VLIAPGLVAIWLATADAAAAAAPAGAEVSPEVTPRFFDINKFRAEPDSPGAIRVAGTNVALYVGGFAWLDVIGDINTIANPDQFVVSSIPVGGGTGNTGSQLTARQSRLFVETDWLFASAPLRTYVEVDFFDPQNDLTLHIRHAFGSVGRTDGVHLIAGQTWTTLMDANVLPSQLDYAGPIGLVNLQQAQLRLLLPWIRHDGGPSGGVRGLESTIAIEAPAPQITLPMNVQGTGFSRWPDLVTALRWDHGYGHLQAAAVFRQLGIVPASGSDVATVGYGGNFTGRLTGFWGKDELLWAVGGGRGVAAYFKGSNGLNLDAFLQADGSLSVPTLIGAMASYQHYFWSDRLSLTAIYSLLQLYNLEAGTDATFARGRYVGGVFQYFPAKRLMAGIEYLFGQRENRNGQTADDNRLQASMQVKF
jgi:hypothetical protein